MLKINPFKYFKMSPETIRLEVMYYVRYPLSFRQVEDILHDRGIDICHVTVRYWVARFCRLIACSIRKKRKNKCSNWQWYLDEVLVKVNGKIHYLWRAVDHKGEVLECYVSKRRNKQAALNFIKKAMKHNGLPEVITTDKLASYKAAFKEINIEDHQQTGRRLNNRCETSHLPFR